MAGGGVARYTALNGCVLVAVYPLLCCVAACIEHLVSSTCSPSSIPLLPGGPKATNLVHPPIAATSTAIGALTLACRRTSSRSSSSLQQGAQATASEEGRAESRASARSVLSGAGLAAKAKKPDLKRGVQHQQDAVSTAAKDLAAAVKERDEALAATAAARRAVADARGGLAGAAGETRNLKPACYGDSRYWEQRHAKSREGGETYEWYTGYPEEALREVGWMNNRPFNFCREFLPACATGCAVWPCVRGTACFPHSFFFSLSLCCIRQ